MYTGMNYWNWRQNMVRTYNILGSKYMMVSIATVL